MGPITPFGAVLPCDEGSTSLFDISYHVDSTFHNITRISKTCTISIRFGVQIQYSEITVFCLEVARLFRLFDMRTRKLSEMRAVYGCKLCVVGF